MSDFNEQQVDEIVAMLDGFMAEGGGHMNIEVASDKTIKTDAIMAKAVTTMKSLDCAAGNLACAIPTLFEGLDYGDDESDSGE